MFFLNAVYFDHCTFMDPTQLIALRGVPARFHGMIPLTHVSFTRCRFHDISFAAVRDALLNYFPPDLLGASGREWLWLDTVSSHEAPQNERPSSP